MYSRLFKMRCLCSVVSVSYTHLDVYKRQVVDELQVGAVGFDLQVERTGGFYGVDVSVYMACLLYTSHITPPTM